jgi:Flp pilus assembly pilin Flp
MSDMMLKATVNTQVRASHWTKTTAGKFQKRYAQPFDRGQTAVEYLGIIAVVVLIVGAIAGTDVGKSIFEKIKQQIDKVAK